MEWGLFKDTWNSAKGALFSAGCRKLFQVYSAEFFLEQNFDGNPRWDTSTFLQGMTVIQETLEVMQATLVIKVTELAAVRSEMICVMEAAARAELSGIERHGWVQQA
jgi:hypothetical protein